MRPVIATRDTRNLQTSLVTDLSQLNILGRGACDRSQVDDLREGKARNHRERRFQRIAVTGKKRIEGLRDRPLIREIVEGDCDIDAARCPRGDGTRQLPRVEAKAPSVVLQSLKDLRVFRVVT